MNLLPGLRDLRTPLATGYLWLTFLYLACFHRVPDKSVAVGPLADVYHLIDLIGRPATLAAVSFIAYMAGALTQFEPGEYGKVLRFRIAPSAGALNTLALTVRDQYARADIGRPDTASGVKPEDLEQETHFYEHDLADTERMVLEELPQLPIRLQKSTTTLHEEYQRLQAEGTFRLNVAVPLVAIVFTLLVRTSPLYVIGLVIPAVLGYQGYFRVQRSQDVLIQAVQMREVLPDAFVALCELEEEVREREKRNAAWRVPRPPETIEGPNVMGGEGPA